MIQRDHRNSHVLIDFYECDALTDNHWPMARGHHYIAISFACTHSQHVTITARSFMWYRELRTPVPIKKFKILQVVFHSVHHVTQPVVNRYAYFTPLTRTRQDCLVLSVLAVWNRHNLTRPLIIVFRYSHAVVDTVVEAIQLIYKSLFPVIDVTNSDYARHVAVSLESLQFMVDWMVLAIWRMIMSSVWQN